jgi:hypothetical protein
MTFQAAFLFFYRDTGPVADVLAAARQLIEQGRFPAVRVSRKGDFKFHILSFPITGEDIP